MHIKYRFDFFEYLKFALCFARASMNMHRTTNFVNNSDLEVDALI